MTENNLYVSFFAPGPSRGYIYKPGFCWCYQNKYSQIYELRWIPNFIDQILAIEFALSEIDTNGLKVIYTGPRHFPWTIKNAMAREKRAAMWRALGAKAVTFQKYLIKNNIDLLYPERGNIHDNIYRYGLYRVAECLGDSLIQGQEEIKNRCNNRLYDTYHIQEIEKNLFRKGIISESIRKI